MTNKLLDDIMNYEDEYNILEDDELYMLNDNHLIERMDAQNKRRNPPTIKRLKKDIK